MFKKGDMVVIRKGWDGVGRRGVVVGPEAEGRDRDDWTPVLWDGNDDPDFFKGEGLEMFYPKPAVIAIRFLVEGDDLGGDLIYAEKELDNGSVHKVRVGRTPTEIREWMHSIAREDGIDLNKALKEVFGGAGP